jgi:hypothetical protein
MLTRLTPRHFSTNFVHQLHSRSAAAPPALFPRPRRALASPTRAYLGDRRQSGSSPNKDTSKMMNEAQLIDAARRYIEAWGRGDGEGERELRARLADGVVFRPDGVVWRDELRGAFWGGRKRLACLIVMLLREHLISCQPPPTRTNQPRNRRRRRGGRGLPPRARPQPPPALRGRGRRRQPGRRRGVPGGGVGVPDRDGGRRRSGAHQVGAGAKFFVPL